MKRIFLLSVILMSICIQNASSQKVSYSNGKELAILLEQCLNGEEIVPDSIFNYIQLLENERKGLSPTDPKSLILTASLAKLYSSRASLAQVYHRDTKSHPDSIREWSIEEWNERSANLFREVLVHKEILANEKSKTWIPVVITGKNEKTFDRDMLNVIWRTMHDCLPRICYDQDSILSVTSLIDFYTRRNNLEAALSLTLDYPYAGKYTSYSKRLLEIKEKYDSLAEEKRQKGFFRTPVYQNLLKMIVNDSISSNSPMLSMVAARAFYPGDSIRMAIRTENIENIILSLYRLPDNLELGNKDHIKKIKKYGTLVDRKTWDVREKEDGRDTLSAFSVKDCGRYAILYKGKASVRLNQESKEAIHTFIVSRLHIITESLPGDQIRAIVVDARSGKPKEGVTVAFQQQDNTNEWNTFATKTTDNRGICESKKAGSRQTRIIAEEQGDKDAPYCTTSMFYHYYPSDRNTTERLQLYTDRAIYRPEQTVQVSGIMYSQNKWETQVKENRKVALSLQGNDRKQIETKEVETDDYGTFTTSFNIPDDARLGNYSICADGHYARFRVEEYKRPTFYVELKHETIKADSIEKGKITGVNITGVARNYNGTPLCGARVTGESMLLACWWWRGSQSKSLTKLDTLYTDIEGKFCYLIPIDTTENTEKRYYPQMKVNVNVLSPTGETQTENAYVRLSPEPDEEKPAKGWFECVNDTFCTNTPAIIEFRKEETSQTQWIFVTGFSAQKMYIDTLICLNDTFHRMEIPYRDVYGDGLRMMCYKVMDNQLEQASKNLYLQLPDKHLRLHWDTFRDYTQPGKTEQWTLRVLNPDSTAARSNVMLRMYDASLDALYKAAWGFSVSRAHMLPSLSISYPNEWRAFCSWTSQNFDVWFAKLQSQEYSYIDNRFFDQRYENMLESSPRILKQVSVNPKVRGVMATAAMAPTDFARVNDNELQGKIAGLDIEESLEAEIDESSLRKDFSETGFFLPQTRTDANGIASFSFTIPQSLTTWHLEGIAHNKNADFALIDEKIISQKAIMAELALPRFVREGDKMTFGIKIQALNLTETGSKGSHNVDIVIEISTIKDSKASGKPHIIRYKANLSEENPSSIETLTFDVPEYATGLCFKVLAKGMEDSDGEMREIPVLSNMINLTDSRALTLTAGEEQKVNTESMFPEESKNRILIIEKTTNPIAVAIDALKKLLTPQHDDALSWASAYYASTLLGEIDRMHYIHRVGKMQNPDGSISWYPGMRGNTYITREVVLQLLHLPVVGDESQNIAEKILTAAQAFLTKELQETIENREKYDKKWVSSLEDLKVAYIMTKGNAPYSQAKTVVEKILSHIPADYTGMGNEYMALVSILTGSNDPMDIICRRLTHTDGYYIAYPGGNKSSIDRRLQVHTWIMEALRSNSAKGTDNSVIVKGMQNWLLNEKRTQGWNNPVSCTNAVWALSGFSLENIRRADKDGKGYSRDTIQVDSKYPVITIKNTSGHDMWAGVYSEYTIPADKVQKAETEMAVSVSYGEDTKKIGDKVSTRIAITLSRDYEYIALSLPRPAAAESKTKLSGYSWKAGMAFYREIHDNRTDYLFESLPRGTYILEDEMLIEHTGLYSTGVPTIECLYAPEFRGHGINQKIEIE